MESSDRSNFHKITLSLLCEEKKNKSEKSVFQVTANSSTDLPSSVWTEEALSSPPFVMDRIPQSHGILFWTS